MRSAEQFLAGIRHSRHRRSGHPQARPPSARPRRHARSHRRRRSTLTRTRSRQLKNSPAWLDRTWFPVSPRPQAISGPNVSSGFCPPTSLCRKPRASANRVPRRRYDYGIKRNISCAIWCNRLARDRRAFRNIAPKMCSRSSPTASSCRTAPAIPSLWKTNRQQVRKLIGKTPIFGICLGHQILGLALRRQDLQA